MGQGLINGYSEPGYEKIGEAFASCFADGLEHGAAVAVVIDGKMMVDLWGGHANAAKTKPWQRDTLVNVWSVTKGVVAAAMAMLVERGTIAYDAPVAAVWPEFAVNGKERITLDQVLSHTAGLNGLNTPMTVEQLYAWTPYVEALGAMRPNWEPGRACAYHALSYGHLAGEVLRRATGQSAGAFVRDEIAARVGAEFFIGLPEAEDHRAAEMIEGPKASDWVAGVLASPYPQSCMNPRPVATEPNTRAWRAAEIPGGNGHCSARDLALIYGDIAGRSSRLLSAAARDEACRERYRGMDASFGLPTVWGAGFRLEDDAYAPYASRRAFGHNGWGGSMAFGDPEAGIGFAYVTCNMLGFDTVDPRRERLIRAVYGKA